MSRGSNSNVFMTFIQFAVENSITVSSTQHVILPDLMMRLQMSLINIKNSGPSTVPRRTPIVTLCN